MHKQQIFIKRHVCIFMRGIILIFVAYNTTIFSADNAEQTTIQTTGPTYGTAAPISQIMDNQKKQTSSQSPTCLETWNYFRKNCCCNVQCIKEDCVGDDPCCSIKCICECLGFVLLGLFCPCCIKSH